MTTAGHSPLRVVVVVESMHVPHWIAWLVARIDELEALDLTAITAAAATRPVAPEPPPGLVERLYERADVRAFGPAAALRTADVSAIAERPAAAPSEPDVVLWLVPSGIAAWDGEPPRCGVWALAPLDVGGAPVERLLDHHNRLATTPTVLVLVAGSARHAIARTSSPVHPLSITRTRNAAAWASAHLVVRALQAAARGDPVAPQIAALPAAAAPPSSAATAGRVVSVTARGLAARSRVFWTRPEWFVAVRPCSADARVRGPLRPIRNPDGRYLADPFPVVVDGRLVLFAEDYSRAAGKAVISVLEPRAGGGWSDPTPVLERDHHLSYPFVFEHGGGVYLLPEAGQSGRVVLYRASAFPHRWEPDRVLLDGVTAVDATLHVDGGVLWLFAHVVQGPGDAGALHLYSAATLDGPWVPHPRNPVSTDPVGARPAGRLFRRGAALIRPGQDCSRRYGEAVVLHRVETLTAGEYAETPCGRIDPDWAPGLLGTHTFTAAGGYEFVDGFHRVRRIGRRRATAAARPPAAAG
jgi:hypothetical protein